MTRLYEPMALISGCWTEADGARFAVFAPADGSHIADVDDCGEPEADAAIAAATAALPAWRALSAADRAQFLHRWHGLILNEIDAVAPLITQEMGKPLAEAIGEIRYGASFISWFAEEAPGARGHHRASPNIRTSNMLMGGLSPREGKA